MTHTTKFVWSHAVLDWQYLAIGPEPMCLLAFVTLSTEIVLRNNEDELMFS